eukprot:TRINITY_DN16484_c0_g1_i2.p1 TRINITY_DN16484_c0_g1~~TRINITY_DN16484_c0_g1_i2.p1  ORF type:complete len:242 (-),score=-19.70 TRINITY_DN16484_c0_g1_i2:604-1329(-)
MICSNLNIILGQIIGSSHFFSIFSLKLENYKMLQNLILKTHTLQKSFKNWVVFALGLFESCYHQIYSRILYFAFLCTLHAYQSRILQIISYVFYKCFVLFYVNQYLKYEFQLLIIVYLLLNFNNYKSFSKFLQLHCRKQEKIIEFSIFVWIIMCYKSQQILVANNMFIDAIYFICIQFSQVSFIFMSAHPCIINYICLHVHIRRASVTTNYKCNHKYGLSGIQPSWWYNYLSKKLEKLGSF